MTGLVRDNLDKYYTTDSTVKVCINALKSYLKIENTDLVLEPSAGRGAFIEDLKTLSNNYRFYDISPENEEIFKEDFLKFNYSQLRFFEKIHIIGNPPFGKVSSLAIKFFNHAASFASVIAFIIPRTFRRRSVQNKLDTSFHLVEDSELPLEPCAFSPPMMAKCCFQIWIKKDRKRYCI